MVLLLLRLGYIMTCWTQPPSSSVSPGETVSLACTTTQSTFPIGWYQQKEGQAPRFVHCDGCSRGEGIPDRFTATRSGSTGTLAITNAEVEDEADYFCGSWNSAGNQVHSGKSLWGSVTKTFLLLLAGIPFQTNGYPTSFKNLGAFITSGGKLSQRLVVLTVRKFLLSSKLLLSLIRCCGELIKKALFAPFLQHILFFSLSF
uniref:Ig-like domain-containing protein n=1 Tax=Pseudonaja textilis TaxID=8673 RepID=A0A670ZED8_PSETE